MSTAPGLVIGIGASAGGLRAASALLAGVTPDATTAFVLVMHLDPDRTSHMAELLQRTTRLTVVMVAGGLVLVQNPHEAEFDAMPLAALKATTPAAAQTVNAMPALLADFVKQDSPGPQFASTLTHEGSLASSSPVHNGVSRLCQLLSDATGVDFGLYKGGTLRRRAERRMLLNGGGWDVYLERLSGDAEETRGAVRRCTDRGDRFLPPS